MIKKLFFCLSVSLFAGLSQAEDEDFTVIYDGKDLSNIETKGNWLIQDDGSLFLKPRPGEKGWQRYDSYLYLKGDYADFTVDFKYKHGRGGNSGLYFRITDTKDATASGHEVQILDSHGKKNLGHHDLGGVIRTSGPLKNAAKPAGEWNRMIVTLKDNKLTVVLNGETVQDNLDLMAKKPEGKELADSGKIAIQDHGQEFWVRNIKVKKH